MAKDISKISKEDIVLGQYISFPGKYEGDPPRLYGKIIDTYYDDADGDISVTLHLGDSTILFPTLEHLIRLGALLHNDLELLKALNSGKAR